MQILKTTLLVFFFMVVVNELGQLAVKQSSELLPVKYVRTEGVFEYIAKDDIKQMLKPLVGAGFLAADIQHIRQAMLSLPWVEKVEVKRIWPDAIDIKVYEQKPYVRWGSKGLLNAKGELFEPDNLNKFKTLPLLVGPNKQEKKLLEIMKGLKTALADKDMELTTFEVNERRAWKLILANDMEVQLGREQQLRNFQRFIKTITVFKEEQMEAIAKVDLRYPNGFSVAWKPESEQINWKKIVRKNKQI